MDEITVLVEAAGEISFEQERRQGGGAAATIRKRLAHDLGVTLDVKLVEKKTLERTGGKTKRVIDNRKL
jgi:phenylacetate-CoA ligase